MNLQQAAKQHLQDLEHLRKQTICKFAGNAESVDAVHDSVAGIMDRMKVLSTFIQNQNEMSSMIGEEGDNQETLAQQLGLQTKIQDLRNKKVQMENLVTELQNLNTQAERNFQESVIHDTAHTVSNDQERVVPIELTYAPARTNQNENRTFSHATNNTNHIHNYNEANMRNVPIQQEQEPSPAVTPNVTSVDKTVLHEKLTEISAMKDQLNRLKDMMDTVKLIESKTSASGGEEEEEEEEESMENSRSESVLSQASVCTPVLTESDIEIPPKAESLNAMTQDLRQQALTIATERDRLKNLQDELKRRRNHISKSQEKITNYPTVPTRSISPPTPIPVQNIQNNNIMGPKERQQQQLKAELEAKKKELDKISESVRKAPEMLQKNNQRISSVSSSLDSLKTAKTVQMSEMASVNNANSSLNMNTKNVGETGSDMFISNMADCGSFQSGSSRSLNMVPPMTDLFSRPPLWRKNMQDNSGASSTNEVNGGGTGAGGSGIPNTANSRDHSSPWLPPHFLGPQSPLYNPYSASEHPCLSSMYPHCPANIMPSQMNPNDPLLLQHFIQTQQMMMNSITQCNQLLWIQQREINNLNNAVLLVRHNHALEIILFFLRNLLYL